MPTNTQQNNALTLQLGTAQVECQVIDLSFKPPGIGASTVTEVACPAGRVAEPGTTVTGALTGNVFADSLDTGITYLLATAWSTNAAITYTLVIWSDLGPTKSMKYTGSLRVNSFQIDFSKPGLGKHPLDLEVTSATLARGTMLMADKASKASKTAA